jgi:hypothetical protein
MEIGTIPCCSGGPGALSHHFLALLDQSVIGKERKTISSWTQISMEKRQIETPVAVSLEKLGRYVAKIPRAVLPKWTFKS